MAHLALVTSSTPKVSTTDTRLLKACRQYLAGHAHLADLRQRHVAAMALAASVLRKRPADPAASDLWLRLWQTTPAHYLTHGVACSEKRQAALLAEIAETPARTEAGLRARLQVWRTVLAADEADRLLDSVIADCRSRRRARA
jgi:hypothetical protein